MKVLPRSFYKRPPETVARDLLGKLLVRRDKNGRRMAGHIVEVEAYLADSDPAAHNHKGKRESNKSLYLDAGHVYVHSMRQYCLVDVVTESIDVPSSVLIRAIRPVEGIEIMKTNRKTDSIDKLTDGPGKLCQALNITKELDGVCITEDDSALGIFDDAYKVDPASIQSSARIGISTAKDLPLRFFI